VISKEAHPAYFRPLISYYLEGRSKEDNIYCRPEDFYQDHHVETVLGEAVAIDANNKIVALNSGEMIPYDKLCICSGSSPFVPPMAGLDSVDKKFTFLTIDDAFSIEQAVDKSSRVLIVGAGLIGLKCAEGLRDRVKQVTVCDLAPRVLSSILDDECASIVQKHLESCGIRFTLSNTAERFEGNAAYMKDGSVIEFDALVLALGVRANIGFFRDAGGECNRAILVNNRMETSVEGIYAAGDCAEGMDASSGQQRVLAIWPNAYMQGYTAGQNMAGSHAAFDKAIPMNSIGFFGLHAMTAGSYEGDMYEEKTETSIKRLFTKDDLLKGFILIGCKERAGIYTSMIREKTPVSSVNFELLKKTASTTAFSPDIRRKKFGGVV
jgi:NAD(P)H-nitrite reductase large subunit